MRILSSARESAIVGLMFETRVEAEFAAAHFLADFHGKCERLHGHNYRVLAHARGDALDSGGMVCARLDHSNLNELEVFADNPSAERIARFIFLELKALLPGVPLWAVDVYETPTSRARYYE